MFDFELIAKIVGAALTFAIGIWLGFGRPGVKHTDVPREGRLSDRLHGTWLNRMFFASGRAPRRFSTSRLVAPKSPAQRETSSGVAGDEQESGDAPDSHRGVHR